MEPDFGQTKDGGSSVRVFKLTKYLIMSESKVSNVASGSCSKEYRCGSAKCYEMRGTSSVRNRSFLSFLILERNFLNVSYSSGA